MADDIFSALLSSGLGGGNVAATTAASPFYQGEVSHAGPMGQISQALMPIMQGATGQGHEEQILSHLTDILKLASAIDSRKLAQIKLEAAKNPGGELAQAVPLIEALQQKGLKGSVKVGNLTVGTKDEKAPNMIQLREKALAGDPGAKAILDSIQTEKTQAGQAASDRMAERSQHLLQLREAEKAREAGEKVVDGKNGMYVVDRATGKRVNNARQKDIDAGGLAPLKTSEFQVLNAAKQGLAQFDELESLLPKVLPTKSEGLMGRAMSLAGLKQKSALGTSEEITKFRTLSRFSKMPAIQVLNNFRRIPKVEVDQLPDISADSDTQDSAKARIEQYRNWMRMAVSEIGVDPNTLDTSYPGKKTSDPDPTPTPSSAAPFSFAIPPQKSDAAKQMIRQIYEVNPNATDEEVRKALAGWAKSNAQP